MDGQKRDLKQLAMRFDVGGVQASVAEPEAGNRISMGPEPEGNFIQNSAKGDAVSFKVYRRVHVRDVPLRIKDPVLKMTAANWSAIENRRTEVNRFNTVPSGFTGRAQASAAAGL